MLAATNKVMAKMAPMRVQAKSVDFLSLFGA